MSDLATPTAEQTICPNFEAHCAEARRWTNGIAAYKRDEIETAHRRGFESSQGDCDWCNPPCPTCDTRHRRSDGWLTRLADAAALSSERAEAAGLRAEVDDLRVEAERLHAMCSALEDVVIEGQEVAAALTAERDAAQAQVQAVEAEKVALRERHALLRRALNSLHRQAGDTVLAEDVRVILREDSARAPVTLR